MRHLPFFPPGDSEDPLASPIVVALACPMNESPAPRPLLTHAGLSLAKVGDPGSLCFEFLPGGHLHALRAGPVLVNLLLGCPVAGAMHRLLLRVAGPGGARVHTLIGPAGHARFSASPRAARWEKEADGGLALRATLRVAGDGWRLELEVSNQGSRKVRVQAVHGLDVGLTSPFAARLNESYVSQYIDHRALPSPRHGFVLASRQNQAVDGKCPWLGQTCVEGVEGFCTDAVEFFGTMGHRAALPPLLADPPRPGRVKQDESSFVALFATPVALRPGESMLRTFVGRYVADHPAPTSDADAAAVEAQVELPPPGLDPGGLQPHDSAATLLHEPPVLHGRPPTENHLQAFAAAPWHLVEHGAAGVIHSLFHGPDQRHVVTRVKEEATTRPQGTILRSGSHADADEDTLATTCYAAGLFNCLTSLGHPSFHRLLSVPRERCGLRASAGQRLWLEGADGKWHLLGIPSAFEMALTSCRWLYLVGRRRIVVTTSVAMAAPTATLAVAVEQGPPARFLVTHGLVAGNNEGDDEASMEIDGTRVTVRPGPETLAARHFADPHFVVAPEQAETIEAVGGAELVGGDAGPTPLLVFRTRPCRRFHLTLTGQARRADADKRPPPSPTIWEQARDILCLRGPDRTLVARLNACLPWFAHDGLIHFSVPHGLEQYNGGAWGTRDVTQGSVELMLALDRPDVVRWILGEVFRHQWAGTGGWPQWFMLEPFGFIQPQDMHGDIPLWPLMALCDYLEATDDLAFLDAEAGWTDPESARPIGACSTIRDHVGQVVAWMQREFLGATSLLSYGHGDWDDSLQPARPELRTRLASAWTAALSYQVLRRLEAVFARAGRPPAGLEGMADRVAADFQRHLVVDGVVCGFRLFDEDLKGGQPMLHPLDPASGIQYRLLPMTRSILAGLFTPEQARHHLGLIRHHLLAADGARLMDRPAHYSGGPQHIFQRAESAAAFSREISVFYTHAHIRYLDAMARLGEAEALWAGLGMAMPAGLAESVPHTTPRQANTFFSSSDAAVHDRYEAEERYDGIKRGEVPVQGGWRLYSSGPGLFCLLVRSRMLGVRRRFGEVIFDPVLPAEADGLTAEMAWGTGRLRLAVRGCGAGRVVRRVVVGGQPVADAREEPNPYRTGGLAVPATLLPAAGTHEVVVEMG